MAHTPRHKAQSGRKQYTGRSKKKAIEVPAPSLDPYYQDTSDGFVDRPTRKKPTKAYQAPVSAAKFNLNLGTLPKLQVPTQSSVQAALDPRTASGYRLDPYYQEPSRYQEDSSTFTVSQTERDRAAVTRAAREVAEVKAQREAEAKRVIGAAAQDYYTRTQAVYYDNRQLKYQQYGDDRGSVVGRNLPAQGRFDADADRKFQTTSQRLPTGGYIRQTLGPGSTLWYEEGTNRSVPAVDTIGFWNAVADRSSDPDEDTYRNILADATADKWEQIRNRQKLGIVEPNDMVIMKSLEKFYKGTEHKKTPDDIGFEIISNEDGKKDDGGVDEDGKPIVATPEVVTITTRQDNRQDQGYYSGDSGGWDWGAGGGGGYYGGNVYNITYGNTGYEQRIDPWAYGMVQWRI